MRKLSFILLSTLLIISSLVITSTRAMAQATSAHWKVQQVIDAFKAAGLEVVSPAPMTKKDYGVAPYVGDEAVHFLVPSVCPDCGGRIFSIANKDDQAALADYYNKLAKISASFFSWVFQKDNILVQINGDLPDAKAKAYQAALNNLGSAAQATPAATANADCKPADLIKKVAALKSSGNNDTDVKALLALRDDITKLNVACNGLKFKGANAKLIGPFDLPEGNYRFTLTTPGFFIGELKTLSGSCGGDAIGPMFSIFEGQAKEGAEALVTSNGCRAAINSSNVSAAWTLTIEPVQ